MAAEEVIVTNNDAEEAPSRLGSILIGILLVVAAFLAYNFFQDQPQSTATNDQNQEEQQDGNETATDDENQDGTENSDNEQGDNQEPVDGEEYTVQQGDTLWSIAQEQYGDGDNWQEIADANNLDNPIDLEVGTNLVLPNLDDELAANPDQDGTDQEQNDDNDTTDDENADESGDESTDENTDDSNDEEDSNQDDENGDVAGDDDSDGDNQDNIGAPNQDGDDATDDENNEDVESVDQTPDTAIGDDTYTVQRGDTLWSIAQQVYGDGNQWHKIADSPENSISTYTAADGHTYPLIHQGNVLVIPQ